MKPADTADLWWKSAIYYCLDVETYLDANGDGIGDLEGLAERIDYLADLGISCLWLMPIYPTPDRDDGYDVSDFYGIDPRLGTHGDLVEVIRMARDRGIRVIVDLVVNHTSDRHPWFVSARRSRTSPYRDFYVWTDEAPADAPNMIFPGEEDSIWEYDEKTEQYFLHTFYRHQPDLNIANPKVRDEIAKVIGFWVKLGISGFRVDAVPFLIEPPEGEDMGDPHAFLRDLKRFLRRRSSESMLLGEVNLPYDEQLEYFGGPEGGELDLQFDFVGMQALYLSLARRDTTPLRTALEARPDLPIEAGWANFVRNHDELTLDKLSDEEREEVFAAFAPDESQRIYDRGIVKRLPTMLDGDPRRIRMVYSLMFSLPGAPVLFYGEEIGMAEDARVTDRLAVRTPMQWTAETKGGFSTAAPSKWPGQFPEDGYAPRFVNAAAQRNDPDSLLQFVRHLTSRYRTSPEIGWGELRILAQENDALLVHGVRSDLGHLIAVHNFDDVPCVARIDVGDEPEGTVLSDLFGAGVHRADDAVVEIDVAPFGWHWFRVHRPGEEILV
ncbi:MAG: trehalose synthase [Microbacterium sp. SCN 70-18]|uniref:Alpha-amylase family protein n=1 Tax=Microbacterium aurantiacum TaxID=162393 RepID=A0AAJ2HJU8_9MICO|nr:alpha-amylase family protein [Microbacterium aurantiacum]MBN9201633.1 alpha-amylase family protein [Microbacterium chocolatum]MDS0245358.1 alpha-amylase family protein [Microbacterium aurantiacum]ODT09817.1 MAG: trehalose synthase [Microbacterium sp. SCN 70-18]